MPISYDNLIKYAPDILEALELSVRALTEYHKTWYITGYDLPLRKSKAALDKVRGELNEQ